MSQGARSHRAEVVAIGDELVHGHAIDTNSAHIARELEAAGLSVTGFCVVTDRPADLQRALRDACARSRIVVATGGIGPTEDDRTRHAAAAAAGVEVEFRTEAWEQIEAWFRRRGRRPPESNRRQALAPRGARVLHNRWGSAPGFHVAIGGCDLYVLPGVPSEMRAMLERWVLPEVAALEGLRPLRSLRLHALGLSEAQLGERLAELMQPDLDVLVGITAHYGLMTVRIVSHGDSGEQAEARCRALADRIRPLLGEHFVHEGEESLAERAARLSIERGVTLAVAESCTGGLCAGRLTDVPGVSAVFLGGYVTYSNESKQRDLGVPQALIEQHGAVSEPVAEAMARGAAERAGARLGVAITGVAGPGGGTDDKPVGTVCFGSSLDGVSRSWRVPIPPVSRAFVRERAVMEALWAIARCLQNSP